MALTKLVCVFLILASIEDRTADAVKCLQCGPSELEYQWHKTGLPFKPKTDSKCATPDSLTTAEKAALEVSCDDACMTYAIQATGTDGSPLTDAYYIIRGCHNTLAAVSKSTTTQLITTAYCESGTMPAKTDAGTAVNVKRYVSFCVSGDSCNVETIAAIKTNYASCSGKSSGKTPKCVICGPDDSNCKSTPSGTSSACTETQKNSWCYKSHIKLGKQHEYVHSCSPVNPFGFEMCKSFSTNSYFEPYTIPVTGDTCFCDSKDNCNGAAALFAGLVGLFGAVLAVVMF